LSSRLNCEKSRFPNYENRRSVMSSFRVKAGLGFLLAVSLLVVPVVARAQRTRTFGTPSVSHTMQAFAFVGRTAADSAASAATADSNSRFCSGVACIFNAAVQLPAGALVTSIELDACDTNPAASVRLVLFKYGALESSTTVLAIVDTGPAATPGCAFFPLNLPTPESIDNENNTYVAVVSISGTNDSSARFQAVRIFYNLQVSPAPATATFNDVPTSHVFFRFIQALAAAGITSGCSASPPLYCPDDPVTRGQMAVFLSRALGLQFDP